MPEYNNGIPNNMVQPNGMPNNGATLPGLNEKMYQSQVGNLRTSQEQILAQQRTLQPQDRSDTLNQIKDGEIRETQRQRDMIDKATIKAVNEIHPAEFRSGEFTIQEAKALTKFGKDRADTVRLTISIKDGLDFEMFFDEEGNFVMDNHKNDITPNLIGSKYLSLDNPEMDLSTPEKQNEYLEGFDNTKPGLTMQREEIDKEIQKMGFNSKEEMEAATGVKVDDTLKKPDMEQNMVGENLNEQVKSAVLNDASAIINTRTDFDTKRNVGDVLGTKAEQIAVVGSNVYEINSGKVENSGLTLGGPRPVAHLSGAIVKDGELASLIRNPNNPTEGIGIGMQGSQQAVKGLQDNVAMSRDLIEGPDYQETLISKELFRKDQNSGIHAQEMYKQGGPERITDLHMDNNSIGIELDSIANSYNKPIEDVERLFHRYIEGGMESNAAIERIRTEFEQDKQAEDNHEPSLDGPKSPFEPQNY